MTRKRLTTHQAEVYKCIERRAKHGPVHIRDIGSKGAVLHLAEKGYVTIENRPGPMGGDHLWISLKEKT